jgi:hypothetical protein
MGQLANISDIKCLYPGELLCHSPDKKEVCCGSKPLTVGYEKTAMFFTKTFKKVFM